MNTTRLRVMRLLHPANHGPCTLCGAHELLSHVDADLGGYLGECCAPALVEAERQLLAACCDQPSLDLIKADR